jgi:hypothetical protein
MAKGPGLFAPAGDCKKLLAPAPEGWQKSVTPQDLCQYNPKNVKSRQIPHRELSAFSGASIQIRTGDLILTKDALCRLSYRSVVGRGATAGRRMATTRHIIADCFRFCQADF